MSENNSRRKAKPQGRVKRAGQKYKHALRQRLAHYVVTEPIPDSSLTARYVCVRPTGEPAEYFTEENAAYAHAGMCMRAGDFMTVLDRGPSYQFVPSLVRVI